MSLYPSKHRVLALLGSLALTLLSASAAPTAAAAATPQARPEGPLNATRALDEASRSAQVKTGDLPPAGRPQPLRARLQTASTLKREVFGYADLANLNGSYASWDFSMLSTVALFGLHVNGDGNLAQGDTAWAVWNSGVTTQFISTAHASGVRVLLTIVQLGPPSDLCNALNRSDTTAGAVAAQVAAKGVDGVSIDYEGGGTWCGPTGYTQDVVTLLAARVRGALPPGAYLSISTYAAAASPPISRNDFFNVHDLNPWVDSFFVMAYDSNFDNCSGCLAPTAPLSGYTWSQSRAAADYAGQAGPGKTLMGIPYYGYAACVANLTDPNQHIQNPASLSAPRYLDSVALQSGDPQVSQFTAHRDAISSGQERWDTYVSGYYGGCNRESYWDDTVSLGSKYDNVNSRNLRGIGIWTLNYGGTQHELWDLIRAKFSLTPTKPTAVNVCPGDGFATVSWAPPDSGSPFTGYTVTGAPAGSATASGAATSRAVTGLTNGQQYTFTVTAANQYGVGPPSSQSSIVTPGLPPGAWPGQYHPLAPARILDTRQGGGKLAPWQNYQLGALGVGGVPASGVAAVILNVTETNPSQPGYLTVYPDQTCRPNSSSVNFPLPNWTAAALTEATLGPNGLIDVLNASGGSTDLIVDVFGYVSSGPASGNSGRLQPLSPARIADSRNGAGGLHVFGANQVQTLAVRGAGGVPANAEAVEINLTVTNPTAPSYLSIFPAGTTPGQVSNINFGPAQTLANRVFVPLSADGMLSIYNSQGGADVLVDVTGWLTDAGGPGAGGGFYTGVTPVRILDTRDGTGGTSGQLGANARIPLGIGGQPGMPASGIKLVVLNLTAAGATASSYLSVTPNPAGPIFTSDLNFVPYSIVANLVVAPVAADGKVYVYNSQGSVDVIADLIGWYD